MTDEIQELLTVAARTERKDIAAVTAGVVHPDRLLRALVPLYLLRNAKGLPLNGGDLARFWLARRVTVTPQNLRGALWCWIGYARHIIARPGPAEGWVITPNGVRYVEEAVRRG